LKRDDQKKRLLRELGHAINDTVSQSERIANAISNARAVGLDIEFSLKAAVSLSHWTGEEQQATRYLRSLHLEVDSDE
jgi:hypothetical protein